MSSSTNEVIKTSLNRRVDLRTAAYINAINRLDEFFAVTGVHWFHYGFIIIKIILIIMNNKVQKKKLNIIINFIHPLRMLLISFSSSNRSLDGL